MIHRGSSRIPVASTTSSHHGILILGLLLLRFPRPGSPVRRRSACRRHHRAAAHPAEFDLAFDSGYLLVRDAEEELLGRLAVLERDLRGCRRSLDISELTNALCESKNVSGFALSLCHSTTRLRMYQCPNLRKDVAVASRPFPAP